ncbi:MAG: AhpC/TSA family protein [Chitinophagaceae bacterium]|nr:AhpC/TSA family protein [Chitinophagaceae bacterium]
MKYFLIVVALLATGISSGQGFYFIKGRINGMDSGKVFLVPVSKEFEESKNQLDSSEVHNGKFSLSINSRYKEPFAYRLLIVGPRFSNETGVLIIEPKNQEVFVDSISGYVSPIISHSTIQDEIRNLYMPFFKSLITSGLKLDDKTDELYEKFNESPPADSMKKFELLRSKLVFEGDSLLVEYCKRKPNSYVALWKLIERFESWGYKSEYLVAFNSLSNKLKNTETGRQFQKILERAKSLSVNSPFPILKLSDTSSMATLFDVSKYGKKYILIDYWFSDCTPCLKAFPAYKRLYDKYKIYGFEIIGISVDAKTQLQQLKSVINTNELCWPQFVDFSGDSSEKLFIKSFPTTFLVNQDGVICKKNIDTNSLE